MSAIESLILSGRIVDVMIIFLALEIIAITAVRRVLGTGIATLPLLVNIGAGGSIMLALRAALMDSGWHWIAFFLLAALVFHVSDLAIRWQPAAAD